MVHTHTFRSAFAQRFLAEGREEGRALGTQEGRIEGRIEGLRQGLRILLRNHNRDDEAPLKVLLDACPSEALESLGERLADTASRSDALALLQTFAQPTPDAGSWLTPPPTFVTPVSTSP